MHAGPDLDLYELLGVGRTASTREIHLAYRRLARRDHPDANPGQKDSKAFLALADAHKVLTDPSQRSRYDRLSGFRGRAPISDPRPDQPVEVHNHAVRHGTLELSVEEVVLLKQTPLVLRDALGRTITLPAGATDGDEIRFERDGIPVRVTIRWPRGT